MILLLKPLLEPKMFIVQLAKICKKKFNFKFIMYSLKKYVLLIIKKIFTE